MVGRPSADSAPGPDVAAGAALGPDVAAGAAPRFHSSATRLRSSTPRNVTVCGVLLAMLTNILSAGPLTSRYPGGSPCCRHPRDEFGRRGKSVRHAQHHALPLVRRQPRGSRRLLRVGLPQFVRGTVL